MKRAKILKSISDAKTSFESEFHIEELRNYDKKTTDTLISNITTASIDPVSYNHTPITDFHGDFKTLNEKAQDDIINPVHYQVIPSGNYPDGLEYMDLMTYILKHHTGVSAHLLGQIMKYGIRLGKKDDKLQDAKKIQWYANYLVDIIEQEDGS
jgi:hypothetical protein